MKIQKEIKVCDICGVELYENKFFADDGKKFQSYFSQNEIDLCPSCLCNLMMQNNIKIKDLDSKVKDLKNKNYNITLM